MNERAEDRSQKPEARRGKAAARMKSQLSFFRLLYFFLPSSFF
jgi:hypothetical protein